MRCNSFTLFFSFLLPLGALSANLPQQPAEKAAQRAAESWMRLIDTAKYSESWDQASQFLRTRIPKDTWTSRCASFAKRIEELGQLKSRELKQALFVESLPSVPGQQGVVLDYESSLSKLSSVSETLELVFEKDDVWRVANYEGLAIAARFAPKHEAESFPLVDPTTHPPNVETTVDLRQALRLKPIPPGSSNPNVETVDTKPIALNNPKPRYTDAARTNKVQGIVFTQLLIGADGNVKRVTVSRGLPDGLDEMAIQTAYQMRFKPAMKEGKPVAYWMSLQIDFTL
ncbi:MAG: TonB family protein [Blastocatellia bacterium]